MKQITINSALNGFIVQVGCQTIVVEGVDKLCSELRRYIANPENVEKEYLDNAVNKPDSTRPAPTEPPVVSTRGLEFMPGRII